MNKVIIAVHGLRNKPPKDLLASWWRESITEGFRVLNLPCPEFDLEMAYWAHFIHPRPQQPDITDRDDPLYLPERYVPGLYSGPRRPQSLGGKVGGGIHKQILHLIAGEKGLGNIDSVSDILLNRMFVELEIYYHRNIFVMGEERPAKELIRGELASLLRQHKNKEIMILAHSMGTIIAYDVLTQTVPEIPVHTLITIGSPLGFPIVMKQIQKSPDNDYKEGEKLPTPESITRHWLNFSDMEDVTCLNYNLRMNYKQNSRGVRPFDEVVFNNYEFEGKANPHKSYGYLRTAEMTQAIHRFLNLETAGFWQRMKWVFRGMNI